jgi:hypothetical protein
VPDTLPEIRYYSVPQALTMPNGIINLINGHLLMLMRRHA